MLVDHVDVRYEHARVANERVSSRVLIDGQLTTARVSMDALLANARYGRSVEAYAAAAERAGETPCYRDAMARGTRAVEGPWKRHSRVRSASGS